MDTRDREAIEGLFGKLEDVERQAGPRDAEAERYIAERIARQPGAPYYLAQTVVMQELALKNQQSRIKALERSAAVEPPATEGGGFFSRTGGGGEPRPASARASVPGVGSGRAGGPWGQASPQPGAHSPTPAPDPAYGAGQAGRPGYAAGRGFGGMGGMGGGGGGFLAGAAQTAMGVAGGVLLGQALGSLIGGSDGLFGGGGSEATQTAESGDAAAQDDVQDAAATGTDETGGEEAGIQDASYDDAGDAGGWSDDAGGFDEI